MSRGRQADSARRQRVIAALSKAAVGETEISVSGIACVAGVDRAFLYRHRDLLAQLHALEAAPPVTSDRWPAVTRASLQADLLAAGERAIRLNARVQQLEKRLPETLGEQAWRECGLGHAPDLDHLSQQATDLHQQINGGRPRCRDRKRPAWRRPARRSHRGASEPDRYPGTDGTAAGGGATRPVRRKKRSSERSALWEPRSRPSRCR